MVKRLLVFVLGCLVCAPAFLFSEAVFSEAVFPKPVFSEELTPNEYERGRALATTCSGCHNPSNVLLRDLSRIPRDELATTLLAFKTRQRDSTVMARIAKGYSDHDLLLMAVVIGKAPSALSTSISFSSSSSTESR